MAAASAPGADEGSVLLGELQEPPPTTDGGPVRVRLLLKISDMEVATAGRREVCTVTGWLHVEWSDPRVCRPSNGRARLGSAWRPDLHVLNALSSDTGPLLGDQTEVRVMKTGWVMAVVRLRCSVHFITTESNAEIQLKLGSHMFPADEVMFCPLDSSVDITQCHDSRYDDVLGTSLVEATYTSRYFGGEMATFSSVVATLWY